MYIIYIFTFLFDQKIGFHFHKTQGYIKRDSILHSYLLKKGETKPQIERPEDMLRFII